MSEGKAPKLAELTFESRDHVYRVNGVAIPSVSAIMQPLSAAKYAGISKKTLAEAAERGTIVHEAAETWALYGFMDCPPELSGYMDGCVAWFQKDTPEVIATEMRVYHPLLRYAGTADLLAVINGKVTLVDYKTTQTISDMTCRVQLQAYEQALACHGVTVEAKKIVQLKKDGSFTEREYETRDIEAWKVFGALKTVYEYIQANR